MKTKQFIFLISLLLTFGLVTQCERYGNPGGGNALPEVDEDSDRPEWAGGDTDANTHIRGNDDSGTTRGGDYGDLYVIKRTENGVPVMTYVEAADEYFVQPIAIDGRELDLTAEGELEAYELGFAQEVEFGRLNIVRSPENVLDQAFDEAMKVLADDDAVITLDFCGRLTSTYTDNVTNEVIVKTIDSPRENMAIYRHIMRYMFQPIDGEENPLAFLGSQWGLDPMMTAASCFAAGSDKTGFVDKDEVVYINGFMDCIGLNPIENEYEHKWYFNFGDCDGDICAYNRNMYANRYIQFLVWGNSYWPLDENGVSASPHIYSIKDVFEGLVDGLVNGPSFTYEWSYGFGNAEYLEGFTLAIDDAVQVLDYIHGDSNIIFLPNYTP